MAELHVDMQQKELDIMGNVVKGVSVFVVPRYANRAELPILVVIDDINGYRIGLRWIQRKLRPLD